MSSPSERPSWWSSFVPRSTLVFLVLFVLAAFGSALLVHRAARTQVLANATTDLDHVLDLGEQRLRSYTNTLDEDIAFLADNEPLRAYTAALDAGDTARIRVARSELAALMRSFLRSRPTYAQLRYISADSAGMEIVRFNAQNGVVTGVPDSLLQAKGDRDFYKATMALGGDRHYFSAMDLNVEHGVIERPMVPTLRAAAGIDRPSGIRAGIVVINADLRPLFAELTAMQPAQVKFILADSAQLLLHPDTARCFHALLGRPDVGLDPEKNEAAADPDRWTRSERTFQLPQLPYPLELVLIKDLSPVLNDLKAERDRILLGAAMAALLFALFWLVYARAMASGLARLTARVERYAAGEPEGSLPVERKDEIGRLSRSIGRMQERIDQRVKELEQARVAAEESDRKRRELVANMSHEVRTPLNTIIGMAGEIDPERMSGVDRDRLAMVHRAAQRLKGLVDDMLLHARAGEGRLTLDPLPTDVRTVVLDIAQAHLPIATAKGVALRANAMQLPPALLIDPLRLHQVVDNLVGNAVRFTQQGHVDISVILVDARLHITVTDTGPGIAPELQQKVFERFERAAVSESNDGAGLGLAITHRLVEAMGGTLTLESEPGMGSRFKVELPVTVVAMPDVLAVPEAVSLRGLRVLYVEDVASNRMLMEQWALKWEWDLVLAADSEQALMAVEQGIFDLVLIDLDLGDDMRGTELLFRLRGLKRLRYVPMLVVTAFVDAEHEAEALKAGANDRITKPIDAVVLHAAAAFWTGRTHGPCTERVNTDALASQYDHDPEKVLRAFQQFRKEFTTARIALQIAMEKGDSDEVIAVRHRIRPHWLMLVLVSGVAALDALQATDASGWARVEDAFRCCDRALMTAQRALLTGGPAA